MQGEINYSRLEIRKLKESEHVESFDCGDKDLNDFIVKEASLYKKAFWQSAMF